MIQSKIVEWIIYLAMFAVAVYLMMLLLPTLVGGNINTNPGAIR